MQGVDNADLPPLVRSFERHLRAANRSDRTVGGYLDSIRQLLGFLGGAAWTSPTRPGRPGSVLRRPTRG
jgi:hypothetical protein